MLTSKFLTKVAVVMTILIVTLSSVQPGLAKILSARLHLEQNRSLTFTQNGVVPPRQWVSIGPSLMLDLEPAYGSGSYNAVGRLTTMAVHPSNPNIIYVGSPGADGNEGSGVWKTTDGGMSWTPIADNLPNIAVHAIAIDPTNPDRVYIVLFDHGLYRSDDAGMSWTHLYGDLHVRTNLGPDGDRTVLLINPLAPNMLYLTTDLGVQRSTDGGQSWQVSLGVGSATSLVMDPQDPSILYAAISNAAGAQGIYKTIDGGALGDSSWDPQTQSPLPFGNMPYRNILLAISHPPSEISETVYALFPRGPVINDDLFKGIGYDLFRTTNGSTWLNEFTCAPNPNDQWESYFNCNFAVMIANPVEPNIVYLGGVLFWLSFDGGESFARVPADLQNNNLQPSTPHVDYWELVTDPLNPAILYAGTDGGIYKSLDHGENGTWTLIGEGITNAEMFDLALARSSPNRAIASTQDNGTNRYDGSLVWHFFIGGDGGAVEIDPNDADRFYTSADNAGTVLQFSDAGSSFVDFSSGIPEEARDNCHAWEMTFQLQFHPTKSDTLLDACVSLWQRTIDASNSWSEIFAPPTGDRVVRFSIDSSIDLYYAGTYTGRLFAGVGGENWQEVFTHPDSLKISDIDVDSEHPETIYVSFAPPVNLYRNCKNSTTSGRVYQLKRPDLPSSSLAMTAEDITENLPSGLCVNALAVDPLIPRTLYAATDRGMYRGRSNITGGSWVWEPYDNGMPPADVRDLELDASMGQLYAATFGRGALKVTLETILPVSIDIKPGTSENTINIKNKGKIPVAILSSLTFNAPNEVDKTSLTFGHTGNEASFALCDAVAQDVNGDGLLDLVCHFYTSLTGFQMGDTVGLLKGQTVEGIPIEGSDVVRILNN